LKLDTLIRKFDLVLFELSKIESSEWDRHIRFPFGHREVAVSPLGRLGSCREHCHSLGDSKTEFVLGKVTRRICGWIPVRSRPWVEDPPAEILNCVGTGILRGKSKELSTGQWFWCYHEKLIVLVFLLLNEGQWQIIFIRYAFHPQRRIQIQWNHSNRIRQHKNGRRCCAFQVTASFNSYAHLFIGQ